MYISPIGQSQHMKSLTDANLRYGLCELKDEYTLFQAISDIQNHLKSAVHVNFSSYYQQLVLERSKSTT